MTALPYQELYAERIGGARFGTGRTEYKFAIIKKVREEALRRRPEMKILDFGVGEPDAMADPAVRRTLCEAADRWENRGYADTGIPEFREACSRYMAEVFGVEGLDPEREILPTIGSKTALALLPWCFIDPGDAALVTVPGYPVLARHAAYCGGDVVSLPLLEENGFLPDLESLDAETLRKAKILYLNYPNNPTGASADPGFFARVVEFARRHRILVVHDAAYAALTFGDRRPLSFLAVPGAMDVGVEFQSLSKAFNMTGWRLGWIAGNPAVVRAMTEMRDQSDSGQFKAIQHAGIAALARPEITRATAAKYERRLRALAALLREIGFDARMPSAGFYLYVRSPKGIEGGAAFDTAQECANWLILEKSISTVPWDDAGAYLRFSATFVAPDRGAEEAVMRELRDRLADVRFVWD